MCGRPPPSWWVSPTSLVVFPSSCSRSILFSPNLSLHPFPFPFSLTKDLSSTPSGAAKLSFPPMRPPPEPPPHNNPMVVMFVSSIPNPKTVKLAPSWLLPTLMVHPTRPPSKPPWLEYHIDLRFEDVSVFYCFNVWFCALLLFLFCFKYVFMVFEEMSQKSLTCWLFGSKNLSLGASDLISAAGFSSSLCLCLFCFKVAFFFFDKKTQEVYVFWNKVASVCWQSIETKEASEAGPHCNNLSIHPPALKHLEKLDNFETNDSRNVRTQVKEIIRNWIGKKTVDSLPYIARFRVCKRWFASVPASTQPNRLYVHSATSGGATSNVASLLAKGYPQQTIFDSLHDNGFDFGIYYQNIPATLFYRNLRKLKYVPKFHLYDVTFKPHAKEGKLPNYVVVEQRYTDTKLLPANDDHPSHDVYQGQMFVKEVYETLRASPQWNETLFLITYDEHGGFFDHVATPVRGVPSPDGIVGPEPFNFTFNRLGVRVPTIAVSPWIEKGTVVHGPNGSPTPTSEYEHSSIAATVKKIFNLPKFLTKRDEWAGTFEGIVQTRTEPRTDCPEQLPTPIKLRKGEANEDAKLSEFQQEMIQLAAVLKGDNIFTSYPNTIGKDMSVKQGKYYMDEAVKRFFEAGRYAKKMGVSDENIVKMKPSLTTRSSKSSNTKP